MTAPADQNPRPHHYHFAHRALPRLLFSAGGSLERAMRSAQAEEFLRQVWLRVSEEMDDPLPADGLDAGVTAFLPGRDLGVVQLPDPLATGEAHFVAMLFAPADASEPPRFFTLEIGYDLRGMGYTTIAEYDLEGQRHLHGRGPKPTPEDFVEGLLRLLAPS